jgi:DNA-binding transcriptional LysR family regulator
VDWEDVSYFLTLLREGSVRAAGARLTVSHSTVARRVEALEEKLQVRLFDRTPDGYSLTDAGRLMVAGAERVETEMSALERGLLGQDERLEGTVRVTCTDSYLSDLITRSLAELCAQYPAIELEITTSYRTFDLSKREADIALRLFRPQKRPADHLLGKKLVSVAYGNYVAIAHAERLDPELVGNETRWLGWNEPGLDEVWLRETSYPKVPLWGRFGTVELQLQATHAGLGIANLPCVTADRDPGLRRLASADVRTYFDIWMLSHPDLRDTARLQRARELITCAVQAEGPWLRGERPASPGV